MLPKIASLADMHHYQHRSAWLDDKDWQVFNETLVQVCQDSCPTKQARKLAECDGETALAIIEDHMLERMPESEIVLEFVVKWRRRYV